MPASNRARRNVIDESESQSESEAEVTSGAQSVSDSESDSEANPYVDLEAADDSDSDDSSVEILDIDPFPFTKLPPELRLRVWEYVCPDLRGTGRVLDFAAWQTNSGGYVVADGRCLADQTLDLRVVLSAYRESRRVALSKFPDTVPMYTDEGPVPIHFNKQSDIVMISSQADEEDDDFEVPSGWETVVNLAIPISSFRIPSQMRNIMSGFPNLEHVFYACEDDNSLGLRLKDKEMRWCASTLSQQYDLITTEKSPGYGEDMTVVVCWPNVHQHWNWAKTNVPRVFPYYDMLPREEVEELLSAQGIDTWPLIQFGTRWGQKKLQHFVEIRDVPILEDGSDDSDDVDGSGDEEDDDEEDSEMEADEYESDGIDDAENPDVYDEDDGLPSEEDEAEVTGRFSSPEVSDSGNRDRRRKRRVVESEDEDEEEAGPSAKRQRTIVVDSDDDTPAKKRRAIVIDSEESATEDEPVSKRREKQAVVIDSDSDSGDSDDEPVSRKMTLAQRLRGNQTAELDSSEEEEEEGELDSEEDEQDEDEDEEDEQGGFFDTMADESESEE